MNRRGIHRLPASIAQRTDAELGGLSWSDHPAFSRAVEAGLPWRALTELCWYAKVLDDMRVGLADRELRPLLRPILPFLKQPHGRPEGTAENYFIGAFRRLAQTARLRMAEADRIGLELFRVIFN